MLQATTPSLRLALPLRFAQSPTPGALCALGIEGGSSGASPERE